MKRFLLFFLSCSYIVLAMGQGQNPLRAFYNADSSRIGYKDMHGKIVIPATINANFGMPEKFTDLVSVIDMDSEASDSYFMNAQGRKFGRDSLHFFDNTPDCEQEGFIRFHDRNTDLVGFFNAAGSEQVPAMYSAVTPMHNGMFVALKGAKKQYDGDDKEHYSWSGGKQMLVSANNEVLINDFPYLGEVNYYAMDISETPHVGPEWVSLKGENGKYYNFIHYEKEFKHLLNGLLQQGINKQTMASHCADSIVSWNEDKQEWIFTASSQFLDQHMTKLENLFQKIRDGQSLSTQTMISQGGFNNFIFDSPAYHQYLDNCGQTNDFRYPTMIVYFGPEEGGDPQQQSAEFLRTAQGYKLHMVTFSKK